MGGAMAMIFATLAPNIVDRLVLNDIGGEIVIEAPDPGQPALTDRRFRTIADATRFYRESFHPVALLPELTAEKLTADSVKIGAEGLLVWKTDPAVNSGAATGTASGGTVIQMWSFYQKVKAPVLIVRGAESTALTRPTVSRMLSVLPGTRAVEVPGVGHTPWLNEPVALRALRDFLHRLLSPVCAQRCLAPMGPDPRPVGCTPPGLPGRRQRILEHENSAVPGIADVNLVSIVSGHAMRVARGGDHAKHRGLAVRRDSNGRHRGALSPG